MFMKPNAVGATCYNKAYMFQQPAQLWVVNPEGVGTLMGYGIGDIIEVVSPVLETLQCRHVEVDFVVLADGSKLLKPHVWPDVKHVCLNQS